MEQYWREGIHALSLNEVCRRVSISKPTLYRDFGDEDGLQEAALLLYREMAVLPVLQALMMPLPFQDVVEMLIVGMTEERETPVGCLFTQMRTVRDGLGPVTLARLESIEQERRHAFEAWYCRALERDEVLAQIEPRLAAHYIDTQCSAVLVQMKMGDSMEMVRQQARVAFGALLAN